MKAAALLALLALQAAAANAPPVARPDALRYRRAITVPAGSGQACAVLDAQIFPNAAPSLADLRIFPVAAAEASPHEIPYAVTLSEPASEETQSAQVLNLGEQGGKIAFDLEMPARPYTDVMLELDPAVQDFLATATVTGSDTPGGKGTALGAFTLFDLTAQHLSRDTTLPLAESTFRYLHVTLSVSAAPGAPAAGAARFVPAMIKGAEVPPSREAQTVYSTVAETTALQSEGRESRASFEIPARVPVERVEFVPAAGFKGNFSRDVRVTAVAEPDSKSTGDERTPLPETITGTILRVHATEDGREIRMEELGVPATLGANLQYKAKVEVAIENGDDQPLPLAAVRLEMRQRRICFEAAAAANGGLALYYGDPKLEVPEYDYARLFAASAQPLTAVLGPETLNPTYTAPPEERKPFTERHPEVLWIALIAVVCVLGTVALRAAKQV